MFRVSLIVLAFLCSIASGAFIDTAGPADSLYHPLVDIYDSTGAQRGTLSNPLVTSNVSSATVNGTGTLSASGQGNGVTIPTTGYNSLAVTFSGTWSGLISFLGKFPNGQIGYAYYTIPGASTATINSNYTVLVPCGSYASITAYFVTYSSGTATATWATTVTSSITESVNGVPFSLQTLAQITDGSNGTAAVKAASTAPVAADPALTVTLSPNSGTPANAASAANQTTELNYLSNIQTSVGTNFPQAFAYNTTLPTATAGASVVGQADVNGRQIVASVPLDGAKSTYSASAINFVPVTTSPTDVVCLTGSSSKTLRITRIGMAGSQTTAGQRNIQLIKRSTVDTAGTSTTVTPTPHDSSSAASGATFTVYTANPTIGTQVGVLRSTRLFFATTTTDSDNFYWDFGDRPAQAPVIRGTAQQLCVNLASLAGAGNTMDVNYEWTEE